MNRVLVIRLSSLGDLVLTLPALRFLRRRFPKAHLALAVRTRYASLVAEDPVVDEVFALGEDEGVRDRLHEERWDLVVDLQGTLRSRRLAAQVSARARSRVKRDRWRRWLMVWGRRRAAVPHVVERFMEAVGGEPGSGDHPLLAISSQTRERARSFVADHRVVPGRVLALLPGASHPVKAWMPERFARVGRVARERLGLAPLVLGGEADRDVVELVARRLGREAAHWCGDRDLPFLAALLATARAAVSNDSGGGHLAAAAGAPVITIYGPTVAGFGFRPRGGGCREVSLPLDCRPCSLHGNRPCRLGTHACLRDLGPEEVSGALFSLLGEGNEGAEGGLVPVAGGDLG